MDTAGRTKRTAHTPPAQSTFHCEALRIKRSWWSVIPNFILAVVAVIVIRHLSQVSSLPSLDIKVPLGGTDWLLHLPIYLLVGLVLIARPLFLMRDTIHLLGQHHLYSEFGRMSLNREHIEIAFEEMLGVRFRQNLLERILDVGTILIWTASADRPEIVMRGVRDPARVVHIIRDRIDSVIISHNNGT